MTDPLKTYLYFWYQNGHFWYLNETTGEIYDSPMVITKICRCCCVRMDQLKKYFQFWYQNETTCCPTGEIYDRLASIGYRQNCTGSCSLKSIAFRYCIKTWPSQRTPSWIPTLSGHPSRVEVKSSAKWTFVSKLSKKATYSPGFHIQSSVIYILIPKALLKPLFRYKSDIIRYQHLY